MPLQSGRAKEFRALLLRKGHHEAHLQGVSSALQVPTLIVGHRQFRLVHGTVVAAVRTRRRVRFGRGDVSRRDDEARGVDILERKALVEGGKVIFRAA